MLKSTIWHNYEGYLIFFLDKKFLGEEIFIQKKQKYFNVIIKMSWRGTFDLRIP